MKKKKPPPDKAKKKKYEVMSAGNYLRGGNMTAVQWGEFGEAAHGEILMEGEEDSSSSSSSESNEDETEETFLEDAFEEQDEVVEVAVPADQVEFPELYVAPDSMNLNLIDDTSTLQKNPWCNKWTAIWCVVWLCFVIGIAVLIIFLNITYGEYNEESGEEKRDNSDTDYCVFKAFETPCN